MTGANFAVAETGSFVVCTNEGNADLSAPTCRSCTSPRSASRRCMPRIEHLGVFVRMLSRSALGSPITQITSHFRAPRPGTEMHVVLVDNGRSERLGMEDFWYSLKCIRCGACMNTCPVYRRSGGLSYGATYSGPIGVIIDPTFNLRKYSSLPFASTLNGSCTSVCPVKINIHEQIYKWRQVIAERHQLPIVKKEAMQIAGQLLREPDALSRRGRGRGRRPRAPAALHASTTRSTPGAGSARCRRRRRQTFRQWYVKNRGASEMSSRDAHPRPRARATSPRARALPEVPVVRAAARRSAGRVRGRAARGWAARVAEPPRGGTLDAFIRARFPQAQVICSATPEVDGTRALVDRARAGRRSTTSTSAWCARVFGVAETGSVWLSEARVHRQRAGLPVAAPRRAARSAAIVAEPARRLPAPGLRRRALRRAHDRPVGDRRHRGRA